MDLAGVVVLYNADQESVIENISSYLHELDLLIAIDNTEVTTNQPLLIDFIARHQKIKYIANGENLGIAKALNIGARKAIKLGYQWLFTIDQDSKASPTMLPILKNYICSSDTSLLGIVSPFHLVTEITEKSQPFKDEVEESLTVITSGNIVNLKAFQQVGGFDDSYFIDYVDHEYCLRLQKHGFKIITLNRAQLIHNLGHIKQQFSLLTTNHNFIRRYYITRNRLRLIKDYRNDFPAYCKADFLKMWKELFKIFFFEKDKLKKFRSFLTGIHHFTINKTGPYKIK